MFLSCVWIIFLLRCVRFTNIHVTWRINLIIVLLRSLCFEKRLQIIALIFQIFVAEEYRNFNILLRWNLELFFVRTSIERRETRISYTSREYKCLSVRLVRKNGEESGVRARIYTATTGPLARERTCDAAEEGREWLKGEVKEKAARSKQRRGNGEWEKEKRIARRGLQEGSALSCKSVRSLSPPGGMVAYVKAGYTPRDEWTLFHQRFFF